MSTEKNIKALQLRFRLYGLPQEWYGVTFDDTGLPKPEADRLKEAFSSIRKGSVCYVQGCPAPIANQYIDKGFIVRGVDASIYISDPFDKEEKKGIPDGDVLFLYNCFEGTTQMPLVQKVLKKLVQSVGGGTMVIMSGDTLGRTFAKDFYNTPNTCTIPKKPEGKWL